MLVPDPALVDEPPGRPPLLVRQLLPGVGHSPPYLALQQLELVRNAKLAITFPAARRHGGGASAVRTRRRCRR